jgi:O-antigen ligase
MLIDRFATLGQLLSEPTQDLSYQMRRQEFDSAVALFQSSPFVGTGPGHLIDYPSLTGQAILTFSVDTGMTLPAKFGLVGIAAVVAIFVALLVVLKGTAAAIRAQASRAALVGFVLVGAIWSLLGSPLEDKGFSFGMILLLALALVDYQESLAAIQSKGIDVLR